MSNGRIRKGVDRSIKAAVNSQKLDLEAHAAPIAMLRLMADYLDRTGMETASLRSITPSMFLSYCQALGLTPDETPTRRKAPTVDPEATPRGQLEAFRSRHRARGIGG